MVQLELCKRGSIKTSSRGKEEKKEKIVTKKRKTEKKHINPQNEINFYTHKFSFFPVVVGVGEDFRSHTPKALFRSQVVQTKQKTKQKPLEKLEKNEVYVVSS